MVIPLTSLRLWSLFLLNLLLLNPLAASGLVNVTVEHGDPQIVYGPKFDVEWKEAWPGVKTSSDPRAVATFSFTGTALFYEGWLWSTTTMFQAQVDNQTSMTIDLTDPEYAGNPNNTVPTSSNLKSFLLWPLPGTPPSDQTGEALHTISFSMNSGQRAIVIGKLIYSTDNPPPNLTTTSGFAPTPSSPQATESKNPQILIPSIVGGVIGLGLLIGLIVCCIRRHRHPPRVRFDSPIVTKTTTVTQDQTQMRNNGSSLSLKRATRGLVDQVWDPKVVHVKQLDAAARPDWRIE